MSPSDLINIVLLLKYHTDIGEMLSQYSVAKSLP